MTADSGSSPAGAVPAPGKRKNPWISLVLSMLIPGLGQLYNGLWLKAIAVFFAFLLTLVTVICPIIIWLYAMYDAYTTAVKINKGIAVRDWQASEDMMDL